jgi:AcrR family transcriptional regulator
MSEGFDVNKIGLSLRDAQKEQRRAQILSAASKLFTDIGFDETTMENVAREAIVSVPTVYTYFNSKSELLLALFEADERLVEPCVLEILASPPANPVDAIIAVELAIIQKGYDVRQKRVWREISAAALRSGEEQRQEFQDIQSTRERWLQRMFEILMERGQVRPDLDCARAARTIYAIGRNSFRMYIMSSALTEQDLEKQIREDVALAFAGMAGG